MLIIIFIFVYKNKYNKMEIQNLFTLSSKSLTNKIGIYKISYNEHIYIGSSKNLYMRLLEHRRDLSNNKHSNEYLQRLSNKYGIENLIVEILKYFNLEQRIILEKFYIKFLK